MKNFLMFITGVVAGLVLSFLIGIDSTEISKSTQLPLATTPAEPVELPVTTKPAEPAKQAKPTVTTKPAQAAKPAKPKVSDKGITMFETKGRCISEKKFKVSKVLESGHALAEENYKDHDAIFAGLTVLFYKQEGVYHYDEEIIIVPSGQCVRQIGIYQYSSKTVPVVEISNK